MMPGPANTSPPSPTTSVRVLSQFVSIPTLDHSLPERRDSSEIILRAPRGTCDRVLEACESKADLTGDEILTETGLHRHPKEAIHTLESLGFLSRSREAKAAKYHLTARGFGYLKADSTTKPTLMSEALGSNQNFVLFFSAFVNGRRDFSTVDLAKYVAKNYHLSENTSALYSGYALSFLRFAQMVRPSKRSPFKYELSWALPESEVAAHEVAPAEAKPTSQLMRRRHKVSVEKYHDLKNGLFESATHLADILHSEDRFKLRPDRAEVERMIEKALSGLATDLGAFSTAVALVRQEAVHGLRDGDREEVARSFRWMATLAKLVSERADLLLA